MTMRNLKNLKKKDILHSIGLAEHDPVAKLFGGLGFFTLGVLFGWGVGVLFAPKRGEEIRAQLGEALKRRGRVAQDYARDIGMEAGERPAGTPTM
jgi:hypothetical protein